jgi:hypothetical protein
VPERSLPTASEAFPPHPHRISDELRSKVIPVDLRRLLDAIRQVESGGNNRAVAGRSLGPYQCGLCAWLDGGGKAADYPRLAYDRAATEAVMFRYWTRYGAVTDEQKARCWNSGSGWKSKYQLTNAYWVKVKKELAK